MPLAPSAIRQELDANALRDLGLEAGEARGLFETLTFERPSYLFDLRRVKNCSLGAFSYVNGLNTTSLYDSRIGRYCSIAEAVVVGPYEHPTDGLTSHTFAFAGPDQFPAFFLFPDYQRLAVETSRRMEMNERETRIGHDVWIGAGAFIRRGVTIGDGAVIAAHAVVTQDVPPYAVVVGMPAKVMRLRFDERIVERLLQLKWWLYDLAPHKAELDYSRIEGSLEGLEQRLAEGRLDLLNPDTWRLTKVKGVTRFHAEKLDAPLF